MSGASGDRVQGLSSRVGPRSAPWKAVDLDPGIAKSRELLDRFYQYNDRVEEANRELFSAMELDPSDEDSFAAYLKFLGEFEDRGFAAKLYLAVKQNTLLPKERVLELESKLLLP